MNLMIRIVVFIFLLNISVGLLSLVPGLDLTSYPQNSGGLEYNYEYANNFTQVLSQDPNIQNDNTNGWFNSILDVVGLGFINRILELVNQFFYGFISQLLRPIFGPYLGEPTASIIFTSLYTINTLIYTFGVLRLFTKNQVDVTQR